MRENLTLTEVAAVVFFGLFGVAALGMTLSDPESLKNASFAKDVVAGLLNFGSIAIVVGALGIADWIGKRRK